MIIRQAIHQDLGRLRKRASNPISAGAYRILIGGDYGVDRLIDESNFHHSLIFHQSVQCY
jgi:hypothetical protein